MNDKSQSTEENILAAVKMVLTQVIRDTATSPGIKHPLSEPTIGGLRDCLVMISQREQELAAAAGREMDARPRYVDEPKPQGDVVIPIDSIKRK